MNSRQLKTYKRLIDKFYEMNTKQADPILLPHIGILNGLYLEISRIVDTEEKIFIKKTVGFLNPSNNRNESRG